MLTLNAQKRHSETSIKAQGKNDMKNTKKTPITAKEFKDRYAGIKERIAGIKAQLKEIRKASLEISRDADRLYTDGNDLYAETPTGIVPAFQKLSDMMGELEHWRDIHIEIGRAVENV